MPTTDKIDFKAKMVTWEKEYFIKINGSIQKEDIMITNIYVTRGCKIHEQKLTELQGEKDNLTTIVKDVNAPFSILD